MWSKAIALLFCIILLPAAAGAQGSEQAKSKLIEDLRLEVARLHHEIDSLKSLRPADLLAQSDMLDRLEENLEKRLTYLESKIDAVSRATAPVAFNPIGRQKRQRRVDWHVPPHYTVPVPSQTRALSSKVPVESASASEAAGRSTWRLRPSGCGRRRLRLPFAANTQPSRPSPFGARRSDHPWAQALWLLRSNQNKARPKAAFQGKRRDSWNGHGRVIVVCGDGV